MVKYQGGKHRIGREIASVIKRIEAEMGLENTPYYEPMMGAGGIFKWMEYSDDDDRRSHSRSYENDSRNSNNSLKSTKSKSRNSNKSRDNESGKKIARLRFGSDIDEDMIAMWKALQKGWQPPEHMTEKQWNKLKTSKGGPSAEKGFAGSFLSFGGQKWAGWAEKYDPGHNYAKQAAKSLNKFRDQMKNAKYWAGSYLDVPHDLSGLTILNDPPYIRSMKAKPNENFAKFNHHKFWKTMERWAQNNLVFVCEEECPEEFADNWIVVWEKDYRRGQANQRKNTRQFKDGKAPGKMSVEKLFLYKYPPSAKAFKKPKYPF